MSRFKKEYTAPVYLGQNMYIKPSYVVSIPEFYCENGGSRSLDFILNQDNLKDNQHNGKLSKKAVTGLKNAINWLCISAGKKMVYNKKTEKWFSFKVNFVTLTLPDTEDRISNSDFQKKLLNPFLTYMRSQQGLKNYVWRLEFQANGKLHCHLSTDCFLHLQIIRDVWNRLLLNHGYLELYRKKYNNLNPNSTDVHSVKKIKNLAAYLAKYMAKKNSEYKLSKPKNSKLVLGAMNQKAWYKQRLNFWNSNFNPNPIKGKLWGCSREISQANNCKVHIPSNDCIEDLKCFMDKDIEFKEILTKPKGISAEFDSTNPANQPKKIGEVFFIKAQHWFGKITGVVKKTFDETRQKIAGNANNQPIMFEMFDY